MRISPEELIERAMEARERAYAPYSRFRVGAAVLTGGGNCYTGCNVENTSYGLTCCAERVAVFGGVAAGEREFVAIALVGDTEECLTPCGACRQVLVEFNPEMLVIMADRAGRYRTRLARELLPGAFTLE